MEIKHVKLRDYLTGADRDKVDFVLQYGDFKPVDLFKIGDILDATFGFVKGAQEAINYGTMTWEKYISLLTDHRGLKESHIYAKSVYRLMGSQLWLKEAIETVNELESDNLGGTPKPDEIAAGVDRFNKFKTFPQFDSLAGGDVLKYEQIEKLPYSICFTKLMLEAERAEYNEALTRIRSEKE